MHFYRYCSMLWIWDFIDDIISKKEKIEDKEEFMQEIHEEIVVLQQKLLLLSQTKWANKTSDQ